MFFIYTNDLSADLSANAKLLAGDNSFFSIVCDNNTSETHLMI